MEPDLEVIRIGKGESFKAWSHGYPFPTVRWHFHPEYELHHVVTTTARYFVGDFIGAFEPGNLVLTGPNLPHNWVSDVSDEEDVPLRNQMLQFTDEAVRGMMAAIPELRGLSDLIELSRSGVLFSAETGERVGEMLSELLLSDPRGPVGESPEFECPVPQDQGVVIISCHVAEARLSEVAE